jgi:hypothetical protein
MSDTPETDASNYLKQIGKMLLKTEEIKREHKYECRKLRDGYAKVIADLHETIFNLRSELHHQERASRLWQQSYNEAVETRNMWIKAHEELLEANHSLETNK